MSIQFTVSLSLVWVMQHVQHHLLIPGLCHILLKQGAIWLQYRISPLIFNFLLVYMTALTLHKLNPMWLTGAQAAILESYTAGVGSGWQGICPAPSPPLPFVHLGCCQYHPEGFGHGWARREAQHAGKGWGGMTLWYEGEYAPLGQIP